MKRSLSLSLALLALLAVGVPPVRAGICALDNAPAATLLLPYFEVDLIHPDGRTTLLSVNNAGPQAVLTNVSVWSDLGVPVLGFQIYLTGYDVETINLRDIFLNGLLPRSASVGQDPNDTVSPDGPFSTDLDFPSCTGIFPLPALPASFMQHLRSSLSGRPSLIFDNLCAGQFFGDDVARGYVTVDTVSRCALLFPSDPGYFGAGGMATQQNVLWGDFFLVDEANNFAQGENMVRIEADANAFHAGDSTFYGRYVGYSGADGREPLASVWASRFVDAGAFSGGTELLAWVDSGQANAPFFCNAIHPRPWFPLALDDLVFFDEQENPERYSAGPFPIPVPIPVPTPFPAEANRVKADSPLLPLPFDFGWMELDFGRGVEGVRRPAQAWVQTLMNASGKFSVGYKATPLVDVCHARNPQFGQPGN